MSSPPLHALAPFDPGDRPVTVLTGATGGIGGRVARELAARGHHLVLPLRDPARAEALCAALAADPAAGEIQWIECDLSSLTAVRAAADRIARCAPRVDRLINNAAIYGARARRTADGREPHLAVNYLAPFLFTHRLLPALARAPAARIVNVSGETARIACIRMSDLDRERGFTTLGAYGQAKLALILFTRALATRLRGTSITVNAVHPGPAATGHLARAQPWLRWLWSLLPGPGRAARNVWRLAVDPRFEGVSGAYYVAFLRGVAPCAAYRPGLVEALYARSAELVGVPALLAPGRTRA